MLWRKKSVEPANQDESGTGALADGADAVPGSAVDSVDSAVGDSALGYDRAESADQVAESADPVAQGPDPADPADPAAADPAAAGPADPAAAGPADQSGPVATDSAGPLAVPLSPPAGAPTGPAEPTDTAGPTASPDTADTADATGLADRTDAADTAVMAWGPSFDPPAGPVGSPVTSTADAPVVPVSARPGNRPLAIVLTALSGVVAVALLVVGCGTIGAQFFRDHAKPGTAVFGLDVTGYSPDQVRNVAATMIDNYRANLELDGRRESASAAQLGISFNLDQTVDNAMLAGSSAQWSQKYSPFVVKDVPLVMTINQDKLQSYLDSTFVSADQRAIPADVTYDADQDRFVVIPGVVGSQADAAAVASQLAAGKGYGESLTVATTVEQPPITDEVAQQVADAASQTLAAPYVLTTGKKSYTIDPDKIGAWTVFTPDPDKGTIARTVDAAKVAADLPGELVANLNTAARPRQVLIRPTDQVALGTKQAGIDGVRVADPDAVVADVVAALQAGAGLNLTVAVTTDPFTTENVLPDTTRWVEVNKSNYTVTRWEGSTPISTWTIVIGKPSTPTRVGVFHVFAKVPIQTMRGVDYVTPDVKWIAYFDGDIALHGNYWVGSFGWGASHGCVGMPENLAKINYDWISVGDMVVVHN